MEKMTLSAKVRSKTGNGPARQLRMHGQIPAIVYGPGKANEMLSVADADIQALMRKGGLGRSVINLDVEGKKRDVQIKEFQQNNLTGEVLHIDFYEITAGVILTVTVPVIAKGKSIGVENGGVLQIVRRELTLLSPANAIPTAIEIDITELDIGDSVYLEDIALPNGVESKEKGRFPVISVVGKQIDKSMVDDGTSETGAVSAADVPATAQKSADAAK